MPCLRFERNMFTKQKHVINRKFNDFDVEYRIYLSREIGF